jgi:4-hydroxythreonine-4-phosphate dehydrogenase
MDKRIKIGITLGDYNGVGPEVIIKMLHDERIFKHCDVVIYGQRSVINFYAKLLKIQNFQQNEVSDLSKLNSKIPNIFNCFTENVKIEPGYVSTEAGAKALICLEKGVEDLKAGLIDALVTGPVNKNSIAEHLPGFKGQTEYIAEKTGATQSLMLLVDEGLRVGLVTNHIAVKDVATALDSPLLTQKIDLLYKSLQRDFMIHKPRIAVLGLNPHSGDNGLIGKEEKDLLAPLVQKARERGIISLGPFAADGFFGSGSYMSFDGVLAMYHDQGLAPFKTISFNRGVNYTAGLEVIRTSPDHGTGYDIAGQDKASPDSIRAALFLAIDIYRNREIHAEMTASPVEKVRLNDDRENM